MEVQDHGTWLWHIPVMECNKKCLGASWHADPGCFGATDQSLIAQSSVNDHLQPGTTT